MPSPLLQWVSCPCFVQQHVCSWSFWLQGINRFLLPLPSSPSSSSSSLSFCCLSCLYLAEIRQQQDLLTASWEIVIVLWNNGKKRTHFPENPSWAVSFCWKCPGQTWSILCAYYGFFGSFCSPRKPSKLKDSEEIDCFKNCTWAQEPMRKVDGILILLFGNAQGWPSEDEGHLCKDDPCQETLPGGRERNSL